MGRLSSALETGAVMLNVMIMYYRRYNMASNWVSKLRPPDLRTLRWLPYFTCQTRD